MVSCFGEGGPFVEAMILDFHNTSPVRRKTSAPTPGFSMLRCIWMCSLPLGARPPSASSMAKVRPTPSSGSERRSISLSASLMLVGRPPKSSSTVDISECATSFVASGTTADSAGGLD